MVRGSILSRLAELATRRARLVLPIAVVIAVVAAVLGAGVGNRLDPYDAGDPGSQSAEAVAEIERVSGMEPSAGLLALVRAPGGVYRPAIRAKVRRIERVMRADPAVGRASSYLDRDGRALVSRRGTMTVVAAQFRRATEKSHQDSAKALAARLQGISGVTLGGTDVSFAEGNQLVQQDLRRAELIALPILMVLLLLFFRGVVAALLPLMLGGMAILLTDFALRIASGLTSISVFTLSLVSALGLGLAIDYSLLIVSRFREELDARPDDVPAALRQTMLTAGRTVCFSSMTVAAALASLLVVPQPYFRSMGLGGALVVLMTSASALLVLPALLALLGHRVNALAPAWLQRSARASARPAREGYWYRLARAVMRRPVLVALAVSSLMIALALPFATIRLTSTGNNSLPRGASARDVNETMVHNFATVPSQTVPILTRGARPGQLSRYRTQLGHLADVAAVTAPERLSRALSVLSVTPRTTALSPASQRLVGRIRTLRTPFSARSSGQAATFLDLKSSLAEHLPIAIAVVIAVTMIAIFLLTGSLVLPLKTLVMNALTVGAAYGILVLVFQDGNLQGPLGYESVGAIDIAQPVVMLAVVLGLSTDYGVFLLDRICEGHRAGLDNQEAVALGLERTGRVITSAALLFCVAFGSVISSQIVEVKEVAFGTTAAILLDATLVRCLLVPALMRLLGDWNWWAPAFLRRLAPTPQPSAAGSLGVGRESG